MVEAQWEDLSIILAWLYIKAPYLDKIYESIAQQFCSIRIFQSWYFEKC